MWTHSAPVHTESVRTFHKIDNIFDTLNLTDKVLRSILGSHKMILDTYC